MKLILFCGFLVFIQAQKSLVYLFHVSEALTTYVYLYSVHQMYRSTSEIYHKIDYHNFITSALIRHGRGCKL